MNRETVGNPSVYTQREEGRKVNKALVDNTMESNAQTVLVDFCIGWR
jgi:hypothetical protein